MAFQDAAAVWDDPMHMLRFDRHEDGEERWHALGLAGGVVVLVVWHSYPDPDAPDRIRIIGARKAMPRERRAYEQGVNH